MNEPSGSLATLRRWAKWILPANLFAMAGTSLCGPAPSEPVQKVIPFASES